MNAGGNEGQIILGEDPLIREYTLYECPGLADQAECVARSLDAVDAGRVKDTDGFASFFQLVKQGQAGHLAGNLFLFIAVVIIQNDGVGLFRVCNLHDFDVFFLLEICDNAVALRIFNSLGIEYAENAVRIQSDFILQRVCQRLIITDQSLDELCLDIALRSVLPHSHGQLDDLCQLGNLCSRVVIIIIDDEQEILLTIDGNRSPVSQYAVYIDEGVNSGLLDITLFSGADGIGNSNFLTGLHRQNRVEVLGKKNNLEVIAQRCFFQG